MSEAFVQAEQSVAIIFVRDECLCCQLHLVAEMRSSFSHQGVSENCTAFWPLGGADNTGIKAALQPLQDDPSSPPPTLKKKKKKKVHPHPPLAHHSARWTTCTVPPLPPGMGTSRIPGGKAFHLVKMEGAGLAGGHWDPGTASSFSIMSEQ